VQRNLSFNILNGVRETEPLLAHPTTAEASMSDDLLPLSAEAGHAVDGDRRVRVRYSQKLHTFCQRGSGDLDQLWWMGSVRDISGRGIALLLQHRFQPGTLLTLELENTARTISFSLQVRVVRVLPQPGGWLLGCTFFQDLTEAEVKALL